MISSVMMSAVKVGRWADIGEVRDAYNLWQQVARTILITAHYRTHQAGAAIDGIIEMRRGGDLNRHERRISFVRRDWPDIQDLIVALDPDSLILKPTETYRELLGRLDQSAPKDTLLPLQVLQGGSVRKTELQETLG